MHCPDTRALGPHSRVREGASTSTAVPWLSQSLGSETRAVETAARPGDAARGVVAEACSRPGAPTAVARRLLRQQGWRVLAMPGSARSPVAGGAADALRAAGCGLRAAAGCDGSSPISVAAAVDHATWTTSRASLEF